MKKQQQIIKEEKPKLLMPIDEAKNKLLERHNIGKKIKDLVILGEANIDEAEKQYQKWTEYNIELLKTMFTNEMISEEYSYAHGDTSFVPDPIWGNPLPILHENYQNTVAAKLNKLESIIERLELFQLESNKETISDSVKNLTLENCVFIGHGHSKLWARLKVFLEDELKVKTISYESESRVGDSITPILEKLLNSATFAILILTAEDETKDGKIRARQNVIHETGLFQGKLGFKKAIILRQEGTEDLTNLAGVQYIKFSDENIEQTFYEITRVLKRENIIS